MDDRFERFRYVRFLTKEEAREPKTIEFYESDSLRRLTEDILWRMKPRKMYEIMLLGSKYDDPHHFVFLYGKEGVVMTQEILVREKSDSDG